MKGFLAILVGLLAILVLHHLQDYWKTSSSETFSQDYESIDYYLTDFSLQAINPEGMVSHEIKGRYLGHWQEKQSSYIIEPRIVSKRVSVKASETQLSDAAILQANEALLDHAAEQVELTGQVRIAANSDTHQADFEMTTDSLLYQLSEQQLSSEETVHITAPGLVLQGKGLNSKLDEAYLRLNSHVKSIYQTQAIDKP